MSATRLYKHARIPIRDDVDGNYSKNFRIRECVSRSEARRQRLIFFTELPRLLSNDPAIYRYIASAEARSDQLLQDTQQYRNEWRLLFNNARTYNVEGSMVYNDADGMGNLTEVFDRMTIGTDSRAPSLAPRLRLSRHREMTTVRRSHRDVWVCEQT